jgi:amino acid adenylation domain-containing protein
LLPLQASFLLERRAGGDGALIRVDMEGALLGDPGQVRRSIEALIARHGALRTAFLLDAEGARQVEREGGRLEWSRVEEGDDWHQALDARMRRGFEADSGAPLAALWQGTGGREGRLALICDHLHCDGISMARLIGELAALLQGRSLPPSSAPGLVQGAAAVLAARDTAKAQVDQAHWLRRLRGVELGVELPLGMADAGAPAHSACLEQALEPALVRALEARAAALQARPLALLGAALAQAWAYWTRQREVWANLSVHGRPEGLNLRRAIGAYSDIQPIQFAGDGASLGASVTAAEAGLKESLAHGAASGVDLARALAAAAGQRPRALSPLTLTSGSFFDWAVARGLRATRVQVQAPETWLDLMVFKDGDGWMLAWNHRLDKISPARCGRLQRQLRALLEALARGEEGEAWPLLREDADFEGRAALTPDPALAPSAWPEPSLHARFRRLAAERGEAVAVTGGGRGLSYRELDEQSDALAAALRAAGAKPGERVGIHLPRTPELAVAIFGVLKSGAAYLPMDPLYPAGRLQHMAEDGGICALICEDAPEGLAPGVPRLRVQQPAAAAPEDLAGPADTAYVIYTSGSTGRPKGAVIRHREVLRLFSSTEPWFRFGAADVWTLFHSYSFDFSVWELFGALCYGGRLVVVEASVARDPAAFRALLQREAVTVLNQTPSAFQALMMADAALPEGQKLTALRCVVFGGEALDFSALRAWAQRYGVEQPRLVNMYGITETTVHVTYRPLSLADLEANEGSLIGVPIPDLSLELRDRAGRPAPLGVTGELYVGGAGLAQGYWRREDLTAERFPEGPRGRLYRTGDLARLRPDGQLEYLGRADSQVKIRGFRVELGELQARLAADPAVAQAAVHLRQDAAQGGRLAAWVVPAPGHALDRAGIDALRARLAAQLPDYMVPALARVDALPLTANGKLDHALLPDPWAASATLVEPADLLEKKLLALWCARLARPSAGVEDDFFASGGQSLSAAAFHAAAEGLAGVRVPLARFLEQPTVRALARALKQAQAQAPVPAASGPWPAPAPVAALWAAQQMEPDSAALNIGLALRGRAPIDAQALRARLQALMAAQPALRLSLRQAEDGSLWMQDGPASISAVWEEGAGTLRVLEALERLQAWQARPFDLGAGPLWRARLLQLDDGGWVLGLCLHHAIGDQVSLDLLLDCLQDGRVGNGDAFAGLGAIIQDPLQQPVPYSPLLGPPQPGHRAPRRLQRSLEPAFASALRSVAAQARATPFSAAALAWAWALREAGWQGRLRVPVSLRDASQAELMGYGVAPLPLSLDLDPQRRAEDQLSAAALALRGLHGQPRWQPGAEADVFLAWEAPPRACAVLGQSADLLALEPAACKAPLALAVALEPELRLTLDYDPARLGAPEAESLLAAMERNLRRLALQPRLPLGPALPRPALLRGRLREPSESRTVLQLFQRQVELQPEASALRWHGGGLDYAGLARRSGAMAGYLRAQGLQPGARVGVHAAPGPLWAAAVLACLEAELVYVPLDPAYPAERLRAMALDADCRLVLSDRGPAWSDAPPWHDLDAAWKHPQRHLRPPGQPRPEDEAYVIFTSGSSGQPRGVRVPHRALENLCAGFAQGLGLGPGDRVLQFVSISFDASLEELLPALCCGAAVALPCRQGAPAPAELQAQLREHAATVLHLPAAYWHACMRGAEAGSWARLPALRAVVLGGEAPEPALVRALLEEAPGLRIFNAYGPTETGISATLHAVQPGEPGALPLGRPLPGVELAVVQPDGRCSAQGQAGELWIAGTGLALGYLHAADDEGRFVLAAPAEAEPKRWYRTGDRVLWDGAGQLRYQGRLDREVKVAGQRLDLEGLERLLAAAPGVAQAFTALEGDGDAVRLCAWVLPQSGVALEPERLRQHLAQRLPAAQVPAQFHVLRSLPLTRNGKVDRRRLSEASAAPAAAAAAAAGDPALDALCALWGRLLGPEAAQPEADFFVLGGTSLKAVRAAAEASQVLGQALRVADLQAAPTPAALLQWARRAVPAPPPLVPGRAAWTRLGPARPGAPLWLLLPPAGTAPAAWSDLARALGDGAELWSLDYGALALGADRRARWERLQAAALESAPALQGRAVQLLGWSVGGLLAAALAPALRARGVDAQRLVLVDSAMPDALSRSALTAQAGLPGLVLRRAGAAPDAGFDDLVRAATAFEPAPLELPVTLVLSEESARRDPQGSHLAWSLQARAGLWSLLLPGGHLDLLDGGGAQALADALAQTPILSGAVR